MKYSKYTNKNKRKSFIILKCDRGCYASRDYNYISQTLIQPKPPVFGTSCSTMQGKIMRVSTLNSIEHSHSYFIYISTKQIHKWIYNR